MRCELEAEGETTEAEAGRGAGASGENVGMKITEYSKYNCTKAKYGYHGMGWMENWKLQTRLFVSAFSYLRGA